MKRPREMVREVGAASLPQDPSLNLPNEKLGSWRVKAGREMSWQKLFQALYRLLRLNFQFIHSSSLASIKNFEGQKPIVLMSQIRKHHHFIFFLSLNQPLLCLHRHPGNQANPNTHLASPHRKSPLTISLEAITDCFDLDSVSSLAGQRGYQAAQNISSENRVILFPNHGPGDVFKKRIHLFVLYVDVQSSVSTLCAPCMYLMLVEARRGH